MTDLHKLRLQIEKDREAMAIREGKCPKCGSEMEKLDDVTDWRNYGYGFQVVKLWHCDKCGHEEKVKP